jgi:hypothetical protein
MKTYSKDCSLAVIARNATRSFVNPQPRNISVTVYLVEMEKETWFGIPIVAVPVVFENAGECTFRGGSGIGTNATTIKAALTEFISAVNRQNLPLQKEDTDLSELARRMDAFLNHNASSFEWGIFKTKATDPAPVFS